MVSFGHRLLFSTRGGARTLSRPISPRCYKKTKEGLNGSITLFNTTQADAFVSAMQIFPVTSAWNEDISRLPTLPNSDAMIAQIMADLASTRRTLRAFEEMNFVLVPDSQPAVPIDFVSYPDESDPSPYPIP